MNKCYRGMIIDAGVGRPALTMPPGRPPLALEVRVRLYGIPPPTNPKVRFDLDADVAGDVHPATGGVSVSPRWEDLPFFTVPRRLRGALPSKNFRSAVGDPDTRIWSHHAPAGFPVPTAGAVHFASGLTLRADRADHGLLEPSATTRHTSFATAITATQQDWNVDEPPPPPGASLTGGGAATHGPTP